MAAHEINYRRFFDINELAAIRVEDPKVFAAVHALPLQLARERIVTGFRIDHVDGLSDPETVPGRPAAGPGWTPPARTPRSAAATWWWRRS